LWDKFFPSCSAAWKELFASSGRADIRDPCGIRDFYYFMRLKEYSLNFTYWRTYGYNNTLGKRY